jgi:hypothetical protein
MRPRRARRLAVAGLGVLVLGYSAGRLHQQDTVAACRSLAGSLDQMVTMYEGANTAMWEALGVVARRGSAAPAPGLLISDPP